MGGLNEEKNKYAQEMEYIETLEGVVKSVKPNIIVGESELTHLQQVHLCLL